MYKIGIQYVYYPEVRNIINKVDSAAYCQFEVKGSFISRIVSKIRRTFKIKIKKITTREIYSFKPNYSKEADFFHLFNSISYGKNNWGVTFETVVPFHEEDKINLFLRGEEVFFGNNSSLEKLNNPKCKFIIAISKSSFNLQAEYLNYYPSMKKKILSKMHVLHPPQKILIDVYEKPNISGGVNFMFIGREFLCKGGIEILRVFEKIKIRHPYFTLTLIGDFEQSNGRFFLLDYELDELRAIIKNNCERIRYFKSLPNKEVLKMMVEEIHVGLLPTHADTYGYSVLEFQSAGCPVITTNARALPEINNNECGWLIGIPKSRLGEPFSKTDSELVTIQKIIEEQLVDIMIEILESPSIIEKKGAKSIERIKENHCEVKYSKKLSNIYNRSINC